MDIYETKLKKIKFKMMMIRMIKIKINMKVIKNYKIQKYSKI